MFGFLKQKIADFGNKLKETVAKEENKKPKEGTGPEKKGEREELEQKNEKKEATKIEEHKANAPQQETQTKKEHINQEHVLITYFVHGTTTDNENDIATGQNQGELGELGKKQAKELGELVKHRRFDVIFTSDLKRAIDSAELGFGGKYKITQDKRLRECNYGEWNGHNAKKVEEYDCINKKYPQGESYIEVEKRIAEFLNHLYKHYKGKHIAIIAHKAPQLAIEVLLKGKTWEQAINEDWRKKKQWRPGWDYEIKHEIQIKEATKIEEHKAFPQEQKNVHEEKHEAGKEEQKVGEKKQGILKKLFGFGKKEEKEKPQEKILEHKTEKEQKKKTREEIAEEMERKMFEEIDKEIAEEEKPRSEKEQKIHEAKEEQKKDSLIEKETLAKEKEESAEKEKGHLKEEIKTEKGQLKIKTEIKEEKEKKELIAAKKILEEKKPVLDEIEEELKEEEEEAEEITEQQERKTQKEEKSASGEKSTEGKEITETKEKPRGIEIKTIEEEKRELKAKVGVVGGIKGFLFGGVEITEKQIEDLLRELELSLVESDVEQDAANELVKQIKKKLVGMKTTTKNIDEYLKEQIKEILAEMMKTEQINLLEEAKKKQKEGKPLKILMLGPNGAGKTTSIAKLVHYFKKHGLTSIIAAGDTFRAGAIDQIEEHANKLGARVIKQKYGADPAAVAFDAIHAAEAGKINVIIIDSAGRQETNKNLMEELRKIERIAKPNYKIFVGEAYVGQGLLEQVKEFEEIIGINGFILTKIDTDAKGGTAISLLYKTKKPIIFVGTGQGYDDFEEFTPKFILERII
jgi:fused signal recognition particle receptor